MLTLKWFMPSSHSHQKIAMELNITNQRQVSMYYKVTMVISVRVDKPHSDFQCHGSSDDGAITN